MEAFLMKYAGENTPGAAVMVIQQGRPVLIKTVGMADVAAQCPVTPQTNFRLASVTKQFTAMCILMLMESGELDYRTRLSDIFPDFPAYGQTITVENLLQHTAGLIDYESLIPDTATRQVWDRDVLQMMMAVDSTYFPPGTQYRYSNTGYALLAMVVEKLSGQSFAEFLHDRIFAPLKMNGTVCFREGLNEVPHRALGYTCAGDSVALSDQSPTSAVWGDGGIYSSLDDLFKWDQALYGEQLVSATTLNRAFTPHLETYGYGWRIDTWRGHRRVHHSGSTSGFRNVLMRFPDDQLTVIILTNRREPSVSPLAEQIADLWL